MTKHTLPENIASTPVELQALSKSKAQLVASLGQSKRRRKLGLFLCEGHKCVSDLLQWGQRFEVEFLVATSDYIGAHREALERSGCEVYVVTASEMSRISALSTSSEVLAVVRMDRSAAVQDAEQPLPKGLYLLLDGVQDPGNLGTIIRTAHWFGIKKIFASHDTVDIYNPKTVQSTMGSLGAVSVRYTDLQTLVERNPGLPLVGLQLDGQDIFQAQLPREGALICMGSEGHGLSEPIKTRLSLSLTIPAADAADHPESLNVAIATAITLAQFCK